MNWAHRSFKEKKKTKADLLNKAHEESTAEKRKERKEVRFSVMQAKLRAEDKEKKKKNGKGTKEMR